MFHMSYMLHQMYTAHLLLFIFTSVNGFQCPMPDADPYQCKDASTQIVFDTVNGRAGTVHSQFELIITRVFPDYSWHTDQKLIMSAADLADDKSEIVDSTFSTNLSDSCGALNHLSQGSLGATTITLNETLSDAASYAKTTKGYKNANIVIFSAEQNETQIDLAYRKFASFQDDGTYAHVCVVALNGAPFTKDNFAAVIFDVQVADIDDYDNLAQCILQCLCGGKAKCDISHRRPSTTASTLSSTVAASTTSAPSEATSTSADASSTTVTHLSPDLDGHSCHCNLSTVWNDVILVIDDSFHSTVRGFDSMLTVVVSELGLLTIQKADSFTTEYHTRMGVVQYGDDAEVIRGLGTMDNDALDDLINVMYNNSASSNLEKGLEAAMTEFSNSANNRPNARNVIVVLTATYSPPAGTDPKGAAIKFKGDNENQGVIVVYELTTVQTGTDSEDLEEVASKGYYYASVDDMKDGTVALEQAMCHANCFCPPVTKPYMSNPNSELPEGGCYFYLGISNYALAELNCAKVEGGIVADDRSATKTTFLQSVINEPSFWIGLKYNSTLNTYYWSDGKELGDSYHPFVADAQPDGNTLCVSTANELWQPTVCRNPYPTICEINQCDSTFYCDTDRMNKIKELIKEQFVY